MAMIQLNEIRKIKILPFDMKKNFRDFQTTSWKQTPYN